MPFSKFEFLAAWLFRETVAPYILLQGHLTHHVVWRNRKYLVKWGGEVERVPEAGDELEVNEKEKECRTDNNGVTIQRGNKKMAEVLQNVAVTS